ncbi:MAG: tetratricopeptide repeat protein [Planctomycetaceae bacterium]|jgi:predicted O-linked N-acetylglucosamine transferase (SPINDLY family)|nr:tetratricopeptide repeat protein [Planctomycetaceae bacterium]
MEHNNPHNTSSASINDTYQSAIALHRNGDFAGAERGYRFVLEREPLHAGALHFLGMLFFARQQFTEALLFLEKALQLRDGNAVYHNNYGVVLKALGRLDDAENAFRKAITLTPDYADAHSNLGSVRLIRNDIKQAELELETALKLQPAHSDACAHLCELRFRQGNIFAANEQFDTANRAFNQAASLPRGQKLWRLKPLGFCPSVFPSEDSIEQYWSKLNDSLDDALQHPVTIQCEMLPRDGFTPSFNLPHQGKCCREVKEKFSRLFENAFDYNNSNSNSNRPTLNKTQRNHSRIRVGFVVTAGHHRGFLRVHSHLLANLDATKFEVMFLCPQLILEQCRQTIKSDTIRYVGFPDNFGVTIKILRETQCDILYHWKVGGGTLDYFLAMAKTAPIQCTSYGSHGTSGVTAIDYYISTTQLEPQSSQSQYTEQLVLLNSYPTTHPHESAIQPVPRGELGLPERVALYFCPHRLPKYHPSFDAYLRLILETDTTGYIMICTGKKKPLTDFFVERLRRALGTELFKRVCILPQLPLELYRKHLSVATCVLDSPVYAGDLTTHDALCQGVPVVTQDGNLLVQRYTSGLYRTMEMESLIATNIQEYVQTAIKLGTDPDYRETISRQIKERNRYIFSPQNTVTDYEKFSEQACEVW